MSRFHYSLIICELNAEDFIGRLFDSIPTRDDLEIIVIDDYSSLDSHDRVQSLLENSRLKHWRFLNNTDSPGLGSARNFAMKKALGKNLIFADADDYFTDDFLTALDKYKECPFDVVYFAKINVAGERDVIIDWKFRTYAKRPTSRNMEILTFEYIPVWSKIFRREFIEKNHLQFMKHHPGEDVTFSRLVATFARDKLIDLNLRFYCLTTREGSITRQIGESPDVLRRYVAQVINVNEIMRRELDKQTFREVRFSSCKIILKVARCEGLGNALQLMHEFQKHQVCFLRCNQIPIYIKVLFQNASKKVALFKRKRASGGISNVGAQENSPAA